MLETAETWSERTTWNFRSSLTGSDHRYGFYHGGPTIKGISETMPRIEKVKT